MKNNDLLNLLNEMGLTEEDMERYWQENIAYGKNQSVLNAHLRGYTWRNLSETALRKLPTLLEKDKAFETLIQEVSNSATISQDVEETEEERTLKQKILSGITLTESELKMAVNEFSIEDIPGEDGRWTRNMTSIIQINNIYYMIDWERGLTEMQEDYYPYQPVQVTRHERIVTQTVVDWLPV